MAGVDCRMGAIKFLFVFVQFVLAFGAEHVPVLIWETRNSDGKQASALSPLAKLSSDDFSDFFLKKVSRKDGSKPLIAVFVEENLSVEDFSWQDAEEHATFSNLENVTRSAERVDFLPSVHSPLKGLKRLGYRWQNLEAENEEIYSDHPTDGLVMVVKLGDAKIDEDRPDFLKRHDYVIREIYSELLSKNKDIIALYTSRHSSWVEPDYEPLVRRVRSVALTEEATLWNYTSIYIYSSKTPSFTTNESDPSKLMNITKATCTGDTRSDYEAIKCRFDSDGGKYRLEFRFYLSEFKYWNVSVSVDDNNGSITQLNADTEIYAPLNFSYHCSQKVTFKGGNMALYLKHFQMQPYMGKPGSFDDAYDCVWFFTAPIWAGLLVTALLGFILILGLTMIMDIKTMDQFDDPKGKTITINVSE